MDQPPSHSANGDNNNNNTKNDDLTPDQRIVVQWVKEQTDAAPAPPPRWDDVVRFCRARRFDRKKSLQMLEDDIAWRKSFPDPRSFRASTDFPGGIHMYMRGAVYLAGETYSRQPVVRANIALLTPRDVHDAQEIDKFFLLYVDGLCRYAEQNGQSKFCAIADLRGFSRSKNIHLGYVKHTFTILDRHYPERLAALWIINAPWVFVQVWKIISVWLDERTKSKVEILGSDYSETLKKFVPLHHLPIQDGGTKTTAWPYPDFITQPVFDNDQRKDHPARERTDFDFIESKQLPFTEENGKPNVFLALDQALNTYDNRLKHITIVRNKIRVVSCVMMIITIIAIIVTQSPKMTQTIF